MIQGNSGEVRDAIVIGGGPAGATVAALLAEYGHDVLLLEREMLPRHHVGESLIPAANAVLARLGLIDELRQSSFPRKYSVQFVADSGRPSAPFYFDDLDPLGLGYTWQVVRGDFDRMLVDRAEQLGADVRTGTRVHCIDFSKEGITSVSVKASGELSELNCRVLIDASGQTCFLANRLGLRVPDPDLKNGTVWTWYRGAERDPGRDEGATIIYSAADRKSWFWYIPLPDDTVSIGCTGAMDRMFGSGLSARNVLSRELAKCPALSDRLKDATQSMPVRSTRDFSYRSKKAAGDGWVLVGDASGFIDPVYSSGVFLALKSAEFAADAIHAGLKRDDLSARQLGSWKAEYDKGVEHFRRLVYAFYDSDFSFGDFLQQYPEYRTDLTNLLIGNVFSPNAGRMFEVLPINKPRHV